MLSGRGKREERQYRRNGATEAKGRQKLHCKWEAKGGRERTGWRRESEGWR